MLEFYSRLNNHRNYTRPSFLQPASMENAFVYFNSPRQILDSGNSQIVEFLMSAPPSTTRLLPVK